MDLQGKDEDEKPLHHYIELMYPEIYNSTLSAKELSVIYKVTTGCIQGIKSGRSWTSVTGNIRKEQALEL